MNKTRQSFANVKSKLKANYILPNVSDCSENNVFSFSLNNKNESRSTLRLLNKSDKVFITFREINTNFFDIFGGLSDNVTYTQNELLELAVKENIAKIFKIPQKELSVCLFDSNDKPLPEHLRSISIAATAIEHYQNGLIASIMDHSSYLKEVV